MNVARLVASVGGYFYSTGDDTLAVHLYGGNEARFRSAAGEVRLQQEGDYPWSGKIRIRSSSMNPQNSRSSCASRAGRDWTAAINGEPIDAPPQRGYVDLRRTWRSGDRRTRPCRCRSTGSMPILTCASTSAALPCSAARWSIAPSSRQSRRAVAPPACRGAPSRPRRPDLFGGIVTVTADMNIAQADGDAALYQTAPMRRRRRSHRDPVLSLGQSRPEPHGGLAAGIVIAFPLAALAGEGAR